MVLAINCHYLSHDMIPDTYQNWWRNFKKTDAANEPECSHVKNTFVKQVVVPV